MTNSNCHAEVEIPPLYLNALPEVITVVNDLGTLIKPDKHQYRCDKCH